MRTALVLSGGGMFCAWQAGAWSAIAHRFQPYLIVGVSAGSLNGYLISAGVSPQELKSFWLDPQFSRFHNFPRNLERLTGLYRPRIPLAITVTELPRFRKRIFRDQEIAWQHLAASCALPGLLPMYRIGGRLSADGGLVELLPLATAAELGATHYLALNVLPVPLSRVLGMGMRVLRWIVTGAGETAAMTGREIVPTGLRLGSLRDALTWNQARIERWWNLGAHDAKNISLLNCLGR